MGSVNRAVRLIVAAGVAMAAGCSSDAAVGMVGVKGSVDQRTVLVIARCDAAGPAQIDVRSTGLNKHLRATRSFDDPVVEVDLFSPGDGWTVELGGVEGARKSVDAPLFGNALVTVTVSSRRTQSDSPGSGDIGQVEFTMDPLAEANGVIRQTDDDREQTLSRNAFIGSC
jgi:hypothetical protein